jgi:hypothetical protein
MIQSCTFFYTIRILVIGFITKNEQVIHKIETLAKNNLVSRE